jgi:hypothetical protein
MNGVAMTLIKKADVEKHRAARRRSGLHLVHKTHKGVDKGEPGVDSSIGESAPSFADDFSLDHSAPGGAVSAVVIPETAGSSKMPETPGAIH